MSFVQEIVLRYRGGVLRCSPMYGWGWSLHDSVNPEATPPLNYGDVERGGAFDVKIRGFCMDRQNNCEGFAGEIVEEGHWLGGRWLVATVPGGPYDLIQHPPHYLKIEIYSQKYREWKKYGWPQFPPCVMIEGDVSPIRFTFDGCSHELKPNDDLEWWGRNALEDFRKRANE